MSLPGPDEALRAIRGAFRLARLDPAAGENFDLSVDGFWRSFGAFVYVAPFYLIFIHLPGMRPSLHAAEPFLGYPVEAVNFGLRWVALAVALYWLARPLGLVANYIPFIIAYNWSQVVQIAFFVPIAAAVSFELVPAVLGRGLMTFAVIATFAYQMAVARTMLSVAWFFAFGIVCFDWVLGLFIDRICDWALYALSSVASPAPPWLDRG